MNELSISVTPLSDGLVTIMDHELPSESDSGFLCDEQYNTGTGQTAAGKAATYPHLIRREIHTCDGGCKKNTPAGTQG